MKIGLVCSEPFYFPGGIQEQVKGLYRFLKSRGHDVKIIVPKYKTTEYYGPDVIFTGMAMSFEVFNSKVNWSFVFGEDEIDDILNRENFDILHFHSIGLFITLQFLARSQCKNVLTFHVLPEKSFSYAFFSKIFETLNKEKLHKIFRVSITSKPVIKYIPREYREKISVIPNGVDLNLFNPKNPKIRKFLDGKINILFVGRLDRRKGLDYLINAYGQVKRKFQNTRLIIVGDGYFKEYCQNLVRDKNIKDVEFEGYVKDDELPKYYATCDIFCSPSLMGESFGVTLLEAMASGKPIVATSIKGYTAVFRNSKSILFVRPKSIPALVKGISKIIENERLRKLMCERGLKEVKKYSWENVGNQFLKIYKDVIKVH